MEIRALIILVHLRKPSKSWVASRTSNQGPKPIWLCLVKKQWQLGLDALSSQSLNAFTLSVHIIFNTYVHMINPTPLKSPANSVVRRTYKARNMRKAHDGDKPIFFIFNTIFNRNYVLIPRRFTKLEHNKYIFRPPVRRNLQILSAC